MAEVISVRFRNSGKLYFFSPDIYKPNPGDYVIVETARGMEMGEVASGIHEVDDRRMNTALKSVLRIASEQDIEHDKANRKSEKEALVICQKKVTEHKLDMKLVDVEYTFDNSKIQFYFTSNGRVDFRMLVKDLAAIFRTRIDLRQIGVRDEAKMLGGLGPCGRPICCGAFLGDFQPVSIKMAKEQNLSLNPTKISGVCGRLMCCLQYEQETYENIRKSMPKVGKEVSTPDGTGVVWDLNVIKETVRVRVQKGDTGEVKEYPLQELKWATPAQRQEERPRPLPEKVKEPVVAAEKAPKKNETVENAKPKKPEPAELPPKSSWQRAVADALKQTEGEDDTE